MFWVLTKTCFVLIPILTIGLTVWKVIDGTIHLTLGEKEHTEDIFTVWPIMCMIMNLFVMIYY